MGFFPAYSFTLGKAQLLECKHRYLYEYKQYYTKKSQTSSFP